MIDKAYRFIYDRLLSKIPEEIGVPLGRAGFSLLPLKTLEKYIDPDYEQEIKLGGKSGQKPLEIKYPTILGACYYQPRIIRNMDYLGFGAITTKSITIEERKENPGNNLIREGKNFYNSDGHKNPGMEKFERTLYRLKKNGMKTPLIVSISGENEKDYSDLAESLSPYADYGCRFSEPEMAKRLFGEVRDSTYRPLIVKLARKSDYLREITEAAIENEIYIINYGNTELVKRDDFYRGVAGKSGPELYPDTISEIRKLNEEYGNYIDIIACGGIDSEKAAIEAKMAGASAVEFVSGLITEGPLLSRRINRSLFRLP